MNLPLLTLLLACAPAKFEEEVVLSLADANNYTYGASLTLGVVPTAAESDVTFRWDALTVDLQGDPVESCDDIDSVRLLWFPDLTAGALEDDILCGTIAQSGTAGIWLLDPEEEEPSDCQALSSELSLTSDAFVPAEDYVSDAGVWAAWVVTGLLDFRMVTTLVPSPDTSATEVSFENDSSVLTYTANLQELESVPTPAHAAAYRVDWSALTEGANADGCDPARVEDMDELWIARYDTLSLVDLEAGFPKLDALADEVWTAYAGDSTRLALADAVSAMDGAPFEDFSGGATWLLGLRASFNADAPPLFLSVLDVE